jgi:hypothetical protein
MHFNQQRARLYAKNYLSIQASSLLHDAPSIEEGEFSKKTYKLLEKNSSNCVLFPILSEFLFPKLFPEKALMCVLNLVTHKGGNFLISHRPTYFVFCRLYPSFPQPLPQCLAPTFHLSNTVSRVRLAYPYGEVSWELKRRRAWASIADSVAKKKFFSTGMPTNALAFFAFFKS